MAEVSGLTFHDRDVIVPVEPTYGLVNRFAPFVGFQMLEEDFVQPVSIGDQHFISAREEPFQRTERHSHKRMITSFILRGKQTPCGMFPY
jgi:hypothetical protein